MNKKQQKYIIYTDKKRNTKVPIFKVGREVRVRTPGKVQNGRSKFTDPVTITKKIGFASFQVAGGKIWNFEHLSPYKGNIYREIISDDVINFH